MNKLNDIREKHFNKLIDIKDCFGDVEIDECSSIIDSAISESFNFGRELKEQGKIFDLKPTKIEGVMAYECRERNNPGILGYLTYKDDYIYAWVADGNTLFDVAKIKSNKDNQSISSCTKFLLSTLDSIHKTNLNISFFIENK